MKRSATIVISLLCFLCAISLITCLNQKNQLHVSLQRYLSVVDGDIPEDLRLTIYYIDPYIASRRPLGVDDLINLPLTKKIVIESKELASQQAHLTKLDPSILQLSKENSYINARLYYVFEIGDSCKLLQVVFSDLQSSIWVNGIEVEYIPALYDLLSVFLSEEDRDILDILGRN